MFALGAMQDHGDPYTLTASRSYDKRVPRLAGRSSTIRLRASSLGDYLFAFSHLIRKTHWAVPSHTVARDRRRPIEDGRLYQ